MATVLHLEDVWKQYRLGVTGSGALQRDLQSWWARLRGREDPNMDIGISFPDGQIFGNRLWALRGVSLAVEQGEVLGIIGRNGAGKSTLLKLISRVTAPTRGQIKIRGKVASLLEVGTGFHPELTGRENIFLNGAILGMTIPEIRRKFSDIVDFSGVADFIDTPVKRYSSGMHVRLAFAVAAHLDAELLLVDEVLAVGDADFQRKCLGKMGEVVGQGRTVLFVSHNLAAIKRLCHRCVLLERGEIATAGDPAQIVDQYFHSSPGAGRPFVDFVDNGRGPIAIRRAILQDEWGDPATRFSLSSKIFLQLDYLVRDTLRRSKVFFAVSREGVEILQSHDTDFQPQLLKERPAGEYSALVALPTGFFTVGSYDISLAAAVGPQGELYRHGHRDALHFVITAGEEDASFASYPPHLENLGTSALDWQTQRLPE